MPAALFHPVMTRLAPVLLFLGVQVVFLQALRDRTGPPAFAADDAYAALAMGTRLAEKAHYGMAEELAMPASRDALWHGFTSLVVRLQGDPVRWIYFFNSLLGFSVLFILVRLAEQVFYHTPFIYAAGLAAAVFPYLLQDAVGGSSQLLATVPVLLGVCLHLEGLLGRRPVLCFSAALCIALAALLQVEFILIWVVMFIQVLWVSFFSKAQRPVFSLVQFGTGLLVCAAVLWPLVQYNLKAVQIPWPAPLDAAFAFHPDAASRVTLEAGETGTTALQRVAGSYALWFTGDASWNTFMWVLFAVATLIMACSAVHEPVDRLLLLVPVLALVLPALHGLLSGFTGQVGWILLFRVLLPLNLLFLVLAIFRLPYLVERGLHRLLPETSFLSVARAVWGLLCAALIGLGVGMTGGNLKSYLVRAEVRQEERDDFAAYAEKLGWQETTVMTDRPGWVGLKYASDLFDLSGRYSPEMMYIHAGTGAFNAEKFIDLVKRRQPAWLVLWDAAAAPHAAQLVSSLGSTAQARSSYAGGPTVLAFSWNAGP